MVRAHGMWLKFKGLDIPDADFNPIQLMIGTKIEMEHTDNREAAKAIAKLHLSENDLYYEYLIPMEIELKNRKRIKDVFGW